MSRLLVHVEGQTEEDFVKEVLRPHLCAHGYTCVNARLLGNARLRTNRGGIRAWPSARNDIIRHLNGDKGCLFTTMVDYYGLPQEDERAWPGRKEASDAAFPHKAKIIETAIIADLAQSESEATLRRFMPFVTMHEFEALLFSDCSIFAASVGQSALAPAFQEIRDTAGSPERINDSRETAPSKRVEKLIPGYKKPLFGKIAAVAIGLDSMRAACPHFNAWIEQLEIWPNQ